MPFFRREPPADPPDPRPSTPPPKSERPPISQRPPSSTRSIIARGAKVGGRVHGGTDLVVEGEVEGEIDLDSRVSVAEGGLISGDVTGRVVEIGGRVVGNVRGRERVEILATGRLEGDVSAPTVTVVEGAFLRGKVEMSSTASEGSEASPEVRSGAAKPPGPTGKESR